MIQQETIPHHCYCYYKYFHLGGGIFSSSRVREAMLAVDRGDFAPRSPYMDQPQGIGWNATISAPHMVCHHNLCRNFYPRINHGLIEKKLPIEKLSL